MSTFHPTKRDLLLILTCCLVLGLFLQFDFSLRFDYSSGGNGKHPADAWEGRPIKSNGKSALGQLETAAGLKPHGEGVVGVTDARLKWGASNQGPTQTEVLAHAPGWTVFDSIYLFNGTWFIVTDNPSKIPLLRLMTSTGKEIWNDEESIKGREPTEKDMRIIFPSEANKLFGSSASRVSGTSFLVNDPPQFLDHYYHFAAELLVGIWRTYASLDQTITAAGVSHLPAPSRMIFPHTPAGKWNDYAKMNSFLSRAIFPSMSYEYLTDFHDRADTARAYLFERVVFTDRAAAFRGPEFQRTWRTASEAITLPASKYWWAPIRKNLLEFVGGASMVELEMSEVVGVAVEEEMFTTEEDVEALEAEEGALEEEKEELLEENRKERLAHSGKPVITYVSRQEWGRRMLKKKDHEGLVKELEALEQKYGWEVNIVSMDKLSRDEQIRLAARTTVMMGVHGNGLTHLLWMNAQNPRSTVIEFFFPGGFAEDYEFTARALGIRHYGVWESQTFTAPDTPQVAYPEGFQGSEIPLNGKAVAELVVQRLLVERIEREEPPAPM